MAQLARWPVVGRLAAHFLDVGWPRTRSSAVVRTRLIDDLVGKSVRDGVRQILLLGAGFDSRPYRLPELQGIPVFEVDHPATQAVKRQRLEARLGRFPVNVHFVPVDFEEGNLESTLLDAGFARDAVTTAIWEGNLAI